MSGSQKIIGALILAAGGSRRLGYPKQLLRLGGESLLRRSCRIALEAGCDPVKVVLGARAEQLRSEVEDLPVEVIFNPRWSEGQATSVQVGLSALAHCEAALILLTDQVALSAEWLRRFLLFFQEQDTDLLMARYENGTPGVPLLLRHSLFQLADELEGDQGMKKVLLRGREDLPTFPFKGGLLDVDAETDLEKLRELGFSLKKEKN